MTETGFHNPLVTADGSKLKKHAAHRIIHRLDHLGIYAQTRPSDEVDFEEWSPNLWILDQENVLAPYRAALATIVDKYASAESVETALSQLG